MSEDQTVTDGTPVAPAPVAPLLSVVKGNPTDEDVAILTAVVAAAASSSNGSSADSGPRDLWGSNEDRLRAQWGAPSSFTNLRY